MSQNKQVLSSGLYIISTPIGNMGDITLRAIDALKACDLILCEDTRVTKKLLNYHSISSKLESYNDVNASKKLDKILQELKSDKIIGLVSDAGTPLISDPGYKLVHEARTAEIDVFPIPGACSPIAALSASGLPSDSFLFFGFFQKNKLAEYQQHLNAKISPTLIFFESTRRLVSTLKELQKIQNIDVCVAREITKMFEEFKTGSCAELIEYYEESQPKGEAVVLVNKSKADTIEDTDIEAELAKILKTEKLKKASEIVAEKFGVSKKRVYEI